jgi:hypothetical protein
MSRDVSELPSFFAANRWRSVCRLNFSASTIGFVGPATGQSGYPP